MADRTSAEICKKVITELHTYVEEDLVPKHVLYSILEIFSEYDFNLCQAFWTDEDMELASLYGICLICDEVDCGLTEEDHNDNYTT